VARDRKSSTSREMPAKDRICNLVPSTGTGTDWSLEDAVQVGALDAVALPRAVDLRESWWDIGDQGATGSCVGWATGDGLMRYGLVKAHRLRTDEHVSPRYVWMGSKETDEFTSRPETFIEESGTSLKAAVDLCKKFGVVTTDLLPFELNTTLYAGSENAFWAAAAQRRATSYFNLHRDLAQWKSALAAGNPILVGLNVDATWDKATKTNGELDTFQPQTVRGGHAVCAVGYRADGRIILRNSWSTAWGDQGFGYASPEYIAGAFFPESYMVTIR
jgi:C1A family cysteine protease